jgi:uncharacterized Zn finger protein
MGFYGYGFPKYVSVGEKRAKAEKKLKQLRKKNPNVQPVSLEGRTLARTWWGKAWNTNLESYADYANRIGRGRSYVRHSAVLDLQITKGKVQALVMGSGRTPYRVTITIKPISKTQWAKLKKASAEKLSSLQALLTGHFPKELSDIFTTQRKGLFPSPSEISLDCDCPDWAVMCKHVAAALYGIGVRLDEDPGLFFTLRGVKMEDLITQTIQAQSRTLIKKAKRKSTRILDTDNLSDVFGINLDQAPVKKKRKATKRTAAKKKVAKRKTAVQAVKKKAVKKKVTKKKIIRKKTLALGGEYV